MSALTVKLEPVLTVYLDQNKWIDLARAETGHPLGAPFLDALAAFKRAVDEGRAGFPLSSAHYFETGKQSKLDKRIALARTMVRLAGQLRIAPPHDIVPWEIRCALIRAFELPMTVPEKRIFGTGVAHAFAAPQLRFEPRTEWRGTALPAEVQKMLRPIVKAECEARVLADYVPIGNAPSVRLHLDNHTVLTGNRFADGQRAVASWIVELGRHRLNDVMLATAFADISDPLALVATELGVAAEQLADNAQDIIDQIPSRWVEMKLRSQRQANPQKLWESNDLNDLIALSIAVPYCDVVVTEKSWASLINAAKVGKRFDTLVTRDLNDVVNRLSEET
ncbi:hypothetical protein [Mycobacterium sp. 852002-40037_SCH5390672]|uniref:hypothetical protein n=1 Tax=Mycobacterium sp. 852002-40037_SCH5390672 TaxID=1834089 RepID=UPI0008324BA5|nr:hypothetical protein [Mycobacterium sp. 852002-40037_SCH5390672]